MKKKLIVLLLALLLAVVACACGGVLINMDGSGSEGVAFGLSSQGTLGNVYSETVQGYYARGTEVSAHASPAEGGAFYCWTVGGYYDDGGEVFSYDKDITFSLKEDTWLFANFLERDCARVLYHLNGGTAVETGEDEYWDEFSLAYYLYPNTLPEMGYFEREGYTLVGYSPEPFDDEAFYDLADDVTFYNIGGKAFEDTDQVIELWCVWVKTSPDADFTFTYSEENAGWFVTGYTGKSENVCIPSVHNAEPVVGVSAGAFSDNSKVKTIVFPSSLLSLQDYSVSNCQNLYRVVLFDSLYYLSDATFEGDLNLNRVYFSAATAPRYSNYFNNHTKKIEIMNYWKDSERPKMIILGGSSTTYAVDAELLESSIDRDYLVLNCGSNGANLFNMTSDWAMRFLKEGDFLLQIIEYSYWQLGGVQCRWETFRSFESCYNVFSWINASKYYLLFDCFHDYLDARRDLTQQTYEDHVSSLAAHGYYNIQGTLNVVTRPNGSDDFWSGRKVYLGGGWPEYPFMIYYLKVQYWKLDQMGVDYAMAFTPLNRNALYDYQTDEAMDAFEDYLAEQLPIAIISDLQENIFDPDVFFDDDYHLAAPYREVYTLQLADDLNAYFATLDTPDDGGATPAD